MTEVNLLRRYPTSKRNIEKRSSEKSEEHVRISREYGYEYFDGEREYGYGGYSYDGRWIPIAEDIIEHFSLKPGMRILDIGCAKGFLVKDLMIACPGLEAFGLDVSEYGIHHSEPETYGRLHLGNAVKLPFPDNSFNAVISINTLHNLKRADLITAIHEMQRVNASPEKSYIQVDSYHTAEEKEIFESWVLTAYTYGYPDEWKALFEEANYAGDYYWTLIKS